MDIVVKLLLLITCLELIKPLVTAGPCQSCLILTELIKNGHASLARAMSEVNSTSFLGIRSFSGFITVNKRYNSNMFFWFFPKADMGRSPWIIWLQGGPGASSMIGVFDLIGPIQIVDGKVTSRNVTWAEEYSLLFIDNPVGAGFSFTDDDRGYPDNEHDVGSQMFEFLQQFLQLFPELHVAPLFIAGQSYAGKYVPALGIQVHRHRNTSSINLKGVMIGNGLIDPRSMMHYGELCRVLGILDNDQIKKVKALESSVVRLIDNKNWTMASEAFNATIEYIKKNSGVSVYNYQNNPDSSVPRFEAFLSRPDVREWLHVGNASFDYDNQLVYEKMLPDIMKTTKPWLEELLEHYGVMCYSGQLDVILAYSLSKYTYDLLQWSRREEYENAKRIQLRRTPKDPVLQKGWKLCRGADPERRSRHHG
ncbi:venom serine carboxypeptidase-like isoform X2 [Pararge aegeria]|uniref:venom serine carboxypeptidase-like isoform X2 n=1 Tax=Pararge aegeria TaxID=116150 RepID=UPI0019D10CFE|nr:venom serine carboxypeptidase-like isoform X2 [Pararge aegeria]